jgi:hypothetical protein
MIQINAQSAQLKRAGIEIRREEFMESGAGSTRYVIRIIGLVVMAVGLYLIAGNKGAVTGIGLLLAFI